MKVKIGSKIYEDTIEPIMIILTEQDKLNISNMSPLDTKYACFPENSSLEKIKKWMEE